MRTRHKYTHDSYTYSMCMLHPSHEGTPGLYHKYRLKANTHLNKSYKNKIIQYQFTIRFSSIVIDQYRFKSIYMTQSNQTDLEKCSSKIKIAFLLINKIISF